MQKYDYLLPITGINKDCIEYLQQISQENGVKCELFWQNLQDNVITIDYKINQSMNMPNLYRLDCHLIAHNENDLLFVQYLYDNHIGNTETLERCLEQE